LFIPATRRPDERKNKNAPAILASSMPNSRPADAGSPTEHVAARRPARLALALGAVLGSVVLVLCSGFSAALAPSALLQVRAAQTPPTAKIAAVLVVC
jgi:hypothetical protein